MQYSWDAYYSREYSSNDLDFKKVRQFIKKVNSVGRFSLEGTPKECLEKLKYISGDKVTNASVLLFGKGESSYNVHLGRFKTESMIIDDKMLRHTLFEAVEETQKYLISQMKVAFEITGITTQRTEILEYPIPAIRELILNCLIHRDYLSPIDVQIKVFDNYITFYNPGKLYGELTVEDLQTNNYQAATRNKLIAEAFYLTGDIEKYGSGFRRIRKEIEQYPTMKLECAEIPNGFWVSISYKDRKTSLGDFKETTEEHRGESSGKKIRRKVTDKQQLILDNIAINPHISSKELSIVIGITPEKIRVNLTKLKAKNLIKRTGSPKTGYWEIVNNKKY